jgi:hypothetical protein
VAVVAAIVTVLVGALFVEPATMCCGASDSTSRPGPGSKTRRVSKPCDPNQRSRSSPGHRTGIYDIPNLKGVRHGHPFFNFRLWALTCQTRGYPTSASLPLPRE